MQSQAGEDANNNAGGERGKGEDNTCRDYLRGVCNRGNKCKYYHPPGSGPAMKQDLAMICRDYQNGKCNRASCKYLHITNAEEKVYTQSGQLPPRVDHRSRPSYNEFGGGEEATRAGKGDPVCKDYLNKVCKRGSNCKFRHVMEDDFHNGPPSYGYEPPRKRPRDGYGYGGGGGDEYLMQENESLRRKVSDLQKQLSDMKGANEVLLEQNARLRNDRKKDEDRSYNTTYSGTNTGYNQGAYSANPSGTYTGNNAYEGYTKFD